MIIAIDGPAGSGKTTVSKLLAKSLGIFYLDTGATYRALTHKAIENNLDLSDECVLANLAENLDLKIKSGKIFIEGGEINDKIRTPTIDKNISLVVSHPWVRKAMVKLQREAAKEGDFVVEGRDITTVVFPEAEYKFYLDAKSEVRAKRRFKELSDKGLDVNFKEVNKDLEKRDFADKNRKVGPLTISENATFIDTSDLTIEGTVEKITEYINRKNAV